MYMCVSVCVRAKRERGRARAPLHPRAPASGEIRPRAQPLWARERGRAIDVGPEGETEKKKSTRNANYHPNGIIAPALTGILRINDVPGSSSGLREGAAADEGISGKVEEVLVVGGREYMGEREREKKGIGRDGW